MGRARKGTIFLPLSNSLTTSPCPLPPPHLQCLPGIQEIGRARGTGILDVNIKRRCLHLLRIMKFWQVGLYNYALVNKSQSTAENDISEFPNFEIIRGEHAPRPPSFRSRSVVTDTYFSRVTRLQNILKNLLLFGIAFQRR